MQRSSVVNCQKLKWRIDTQLLNNALKVASRALKNCVTKLSYVPNLDSYRLTKADHALCDKRDTPLFTEQEKDLKETNLSSLSILEIVPGRPALLYTAFYIMLSSGCLDKSSFHLERYSLIFS